MGVWCAPHQPVRPAPPGGPHSWAVRGGIHGAASTGRRRPNRPPVLPGAIAGTASKRCTTMKLSAPMLPDSTARDRPSRKATAADSDRAGGVHPFANSHPASRHSPSVRSGLPQAAARARPQRETDAEIVTSCPGSGPASGSHRPPRSVAIERDSLIMKSAGMVGASPSIHTGGSRTMECTADRPP